MAKKLKIKLNRLDEPRSSFDIKQKLKTKKEYPTPAQTIMNWKEKIEYIQSTQPHLFYHIESGYMTLYIHHSRNEYLVKGLGCHYTILERDRTGYDIYYRNKDLQNCINFFILLVRNELSQNYKYQKELF